MLQIVLSAELEKEIEEAASRSGQSVSDFVLDAVVERLDDLVDIRLAEEAIRQGGRTYTLEESLSDDSAE